MAITTTLKNFRTIAAKADTQESTIIVLESETVWTVVDGKPALALVTPMTDNGLPFFPMVFTTDGKKIGFACGNSHLGGVEKGFAGNAPQHIRTAIDESFGTKVSSSCRKSAFFEKNLEADIGSGTNLGESRKKYFCPHVEAMLVNLPDDAAEKLLREFKAAMKEEKTGNAVADALAKIAFKGEAVMVVGPGGHGKTYAIKSFAEQAGLRFVEVHGHQQIEAIDLYGYPMETPDGRKVWFDGPVSKAARLAAKGEKVLLFIDEFANIPMREAAGLKAAFEPYKGRYVVHTGRIVNVDDSGIGEPETIEAPVENLQIVAASNFGAGYASEEMDKALKQRFMVLHYEADDTTVKSVLRAICKEKGFDEEWGNRLFVFRKRIEALVVNGFAEEAPTLRHLSRKILQMASTEEEIAEMARLQLLQFVEFGLDGKPVMEQVEAIEEIVDCTLDV